MFVGGDVEHFKLEIWRVLELVITERSDSPLELIAQLSFVSSIVCLPLVCLGSKLRPLVIISPGDVIKNVAVKTLLCFLFLLIKRKSSVGLEHSGC